MTGVPVDWMSSLSDTATIDQLNIPGTHDSGTSYLKSANYHKTNDLNIAEQLQLGIRYFDMRLRCLVNPGWVSTDPTGPVAPGQANFTVHHEEDWCYLYLDQSSWVDPGDVGDIKGYVLQDCLNFLQQHPSEFILFQVQQEHNSEPRFDVCFKEIVKRHNDNRLDLPVHFLTTHIYPTVRDCRGKIVIVNMGGALNKFGLPLTNDKLVDTPSFYLENHWMDSNTSEKWGKIDAALQVARQNKPGQWVMTYVSDGSGALHPRDFASTLNAWVEDSIRKNGTDKHCGTILVDFPTASLVDAITARYR